MHIEKLEECPWCGEVKGWSYDRQYCGNCDYDRLAPASAHLRLSIAAADVLTERRRQVEVEGWTAEHDDQHAAGELARAGASYAGGIDVACRHWPFDWEWWKPKERRCDLVRAAALIIAEIERLDRAAEKMG